jgi:hypothetical protein
MRAERAGRVRYWLMAAVLGVVLDRGFATQAVAAEEGPWGALQRLFAALEQGDAETLDAVVDFPRLRANLSIQFVAPMPADAGWTSAEGFSWRASKALVDGTLAVLLTPDSVLAQTHDLALDWPGFRAAGELSYLTPDLAAVAVGTEQGLYRILLEHDATAWRVSNLIVPAAVLSHYRCELFGADCPLQ